MTSAYHVPVLLQPSLDGLAIDPSGTYVDVTFGGGGHSRAILDVLGPDGRLFAFDCDPDAAQNAPADERFTLVPENFRYIRNFLRLHGVNTVDGILADLGVSSHQFDTADRGFSTRGDGALDMRMDPRLPEGANALIGSNDTQGLTQILRNYGELPRPHLAARALFEAHAADAKWSTARLSDILRPLAPRGKEAQYLAQAFQALRIAVNDELGALEDLLRASLDLLPEGGRLSIISYHSLEDRMVKRFMRAGNLEGEVPKDLRGQHLTPFDKVTGKAIAADDEETAHNPRARSARLRVAQRNNIKPQRS